MTYSVMLLGDAAHDAVRFALPVGLLLGGLSLARYTYHRVLRGKKS